MYATDQDEFIDRINWRFDRLERRFDKLEEKMDNRFDELVEILEGMTRTMTDNHRGLMVVMNRFKS